VILRPGRICLLHCGCLAIVAILTFVHAGFAWSGIPVLASMGVLAVSDFRSLRAELKSIRVSRILPASVGRDIVFFDQLVVSNENLRKVFLEIRDVLPEESQPRFWTRSLELEAKTSIALSQELRIPVRGEHRFGSIFIRLPGRWNFLEAQSSFDVEQSVKVFPEQFSSRDQLFKGEADQLRMLDKLSASRIQGAGTEFESMSEYRDGDDPRRIDWRTSARYRRPIVKRFRIERHRDLLICIDCGRLMGADAENGSKLDCAVDASLLLARVALQGGDRCGATVYDDQVRAYLSPVSGVSGMKILVDHLYDLKSRWRESDFSRMFATLSRRHPSRSLVVVLSDISDSETTQRFRYSLSRLAQRHVVIFVALRTPQLAQIMTSPAETLVDGYRIAVAHRLQKERELSLQKLRRSGVHVLDVTPSELTVPLINQYVALRARNLL